MKPDWRQRPAQSAGSLRLRLFVIIIVPLVAVAMMSGTMRYWQAQTMSQTLYDDALKVVAHAVAREVIITQGDVVSDALLESLVSVLGDPIFYNVSAADGRILAGYTDMPVNVIPDDLTSGAPHFFDFDYNGKAVRAVALREFIADPFFDGWTTVLVWQTTTQRRALSLVILRQALAILILVVVTAAGFVWFSIGRGLRPLTELREAISLRSPSELGPIRRPVPTEVKPLVATMNTLFARLQTELERRNAFIANAAHQIRNPVAAIRAQAEAALSTADADQRHARILDLHEAAGDLSRLSQQLLSLETAEHSATTEMAPTDFGLIVADMARRFAPLALAAGTDINLTAPEHHLQVHGNAILLREAIENLLDNALRYGTRKGGEINLRLETDGGQVLLFVEDDGPGIPTADFEQVFERFVRLSQPHGADQTRSGCGLGLAIVRSIAVAHGGRAYLKHVQNGCCVAIALPLITDATAQ
ncbi:sensor histidine kinase [Roseinatronobacter alkalisoli]|uniref:histidine kinase n=1 Tax=Roseinatronobacter alkalisoli TaxID=3028235 RepID=A0ABT5T3G3_9RHOB|nr:sensor histidine kinase [Roseinatronobacter sp. HJB301]MDD7969655.1 sensor histidine kinase [Roseinatronobacter sp. HJB301]